MRSTAVTATLLAIANAAPFAISSIATQNEQCDEVLVSRITKYEPALHLTSFTIPFKDYNTSTDNSYRGDSSAESTADEFLDLQLESPFCRSSDDNCLDFYLNGVRISADGRDIGKGYIIANDRHFLPVGDHSDTLHNVELLAELHTVRQQTGNQLGPEYKQILTIVVEGIDDRRVEKSAITFTWTKWPEQGGMTYFDQVVFEKGEKLDFACVEKAFDMPPPIKAATLEDEMARDQSFIDNEVQALQLLQEHALLLEHEIRTRKTALALAQAQLHTQKPLDQIIDECDGVVCAAQALLTRINDKITLATTTEAGYSKMQEVLASKYEGSEAPPSYHSLDFHHNMTSHDFNGDFGTKEGYLGRALFYIATFLGVIALCAFIKRKCMSMRKRVERAADLEERRNARAYRRAARRAFLKQRWTGFFRSINCFSTTARPERMTDYDEKRALILQDALLEQDFDQAEKGQVMEAQIRELRNAHQIVTSILQRREPKPLNKDPPPPHVPLPRTPDTRSRSSTSTLPSYDSSSLPDYSSLPEPTGEYNATTDGFAHYIPSSSTSDRAHQSSSYSIRTRSTPISSVAGLSPRVSAETLRTRYSKVTDKS